MPCRNQCRAPFGLYGKPCNGCAKDYERWMDRSHKQYQLEKAYIAFRKSEATDREWQEHFDQVAPVVQYLSICFDSTSLTRTLTHETL